MRCRIHFSALLAILLLAGIVLAQNPQFTKRLILKDGSYQPTTKWEIKGDRVRYYSAERFKWEEVPKDLVDWPATDKWSKERESGLLSEETRSISAELDAERKAQEAQTPTVAPGLKLPLNGGVLLLDSFQGQPQLVELIQTGSQIEKNMGRNILRAAINPFSSAKQSIVLQGTTARVQAHESRPVIFVDVDQDNDPATDNPVDAADRFRLVSLEKKKDSRLVGNINIALTGKVSQQQAFVETISQPFSGPWVKVTPAADLPPGEYALVEMLGEKQINLYVWDFGVNPAAPANPTAWKPAPPPQLKTGTIETPVLGKRQKQ